MLKNVVASCVICLVLFSAALQAQVQSNVFAVPGASSTANKVQVFVANPLSSITGATVGPNTFLVLNKPDNSKFYAIANSGSSTVTVIPNGFTAVGQSVNLGSQATAAVMSQDGRRFAVAAGLLHIFETTTDTDLVPNGIGIGPGVTVLDVAASLDGKIFYVLGSNSANPKGSVLAAVDSNTGVVNATTLAITGPTNAVAVGFNGLIYISAPNQILEVNPNTLTVTSTGPITMNANPGKLVFTPDGVSAFAVNKTPITGEVIQIGLTNHAVVNTVPNSGVLLDQLQVLNSNTLLAYSSQNQTLYQITVPASGNLGISAFTLPGLGSSTVQAFTVSSEVPIGGRSFPQSLYVAVNGTLYREDLPSGSFAENANLSITPGGLSYANHASTGTPNTLLQYGNNQTVGPNGLSMPVVVRVLDNNGNALSGVTVSWTTSNTSATASPNSSNTGTDGYAVTFVTAPPSNGPFTINATTINNKIASFTMTVTAGGGGGPTTAGISIIAGQGQIVFENNNTGIPGFGSPLIVQINDSKGNPISGAAVTFTVTQGPGSVTALGSQAGTIPNSIVVTSDNTGQASANFLSSNIGQNGLGYAGTTISASAPGAGSVNFYMTTTPQGSAAQIRLLTPTPGGILSGAAGSTLPGGMVVQVVSIAGVPIPNVGVTIGGGSGNGLSNASCSNPTGQGLLTDANGTASCDVVLNGVVGTGTFFGNVGYFQNTPNFNIQITSGPPGVVKIIQGNSQSGAPGQKLQTALVVQVTDAFGNILSGVPVTWSVVTPGTVTLSNIISSTDSSGASSAIATLGNIAGAAQVKVTAGSVSATFTLTVTIPSAGISIVSGDAQTTVVGTAFALPLVVSVFDGNTPPKPVQGATVTFQVTAGSATLGSASTTTGANGQASTSVTAGASAGSIQVTASSSGFTQIFHLTARLAGPSGVTFLNAAKSPSGTPDTAVAPGEIVIISGLGIATGVQGLVSAYNIIGEPQPSLAGISITFNGVTAPIYYVLTATGQSDQVAVQVPFETQPGTASVVINSAGGGTGTFNVQVQQFAPGVFETTVGGQKIAVAVRSDGSYVSPSNPAHPGEVIVVYATGLGQVTPATATGSAGVNGQSIVGSVVVGLNNGGVPLISANYAPGLVGVYAITLQVPLDTQTGPAQPLGVVGFDAAGNAYFAQSTVIPIQ